MANPWGLYDLHGNVWEWCKDWVDWEHPEYPGGKVVDPQGPTTGSDRVFRGGFWAGPMGDAGQCRSAWREGHNPYSTGYTIGFRVVLAPGQ